MSARPWLALDCHTPIQMVRDGMPINNGKVIALTCYSMKRAVQNGGSARPSVNTGTIADPASLHTGDWCVRRCMAWANAPNGTGYKFFSHRALTALRPKAHVGV
ncbi:hypothetical protein KCP76_20940 [Salmonella enterica subsp. enterica serovar Weltevreden]|nr:hypothetical protein KCP76_20940 [Salmonella enterica subsp. enterica serovar Weltevreden]